MKQRIFELLFFVINKIKENMKSLQEQAWEIINNFDFKYLQLFMSSSIARPVYEDTGEFLETESWRILTRNGYKIPSIEELKSLALNLLEEIIHKYTGEPYYLIQTGPFRVSIIYGKLFLETVLIECDSIE